MPNYFLLFTIPAWSWVFPKTNLFVEHNLGFNYGREGMSTRIENPNRFPIRSTKPRSLFHWDEASTSPGALFRKNGLKFMGTMGYQLPGFLASRLPSFPASRLFSNHFYSPYWIWRKAILHKNMTVPIFRLRRRNFYWWNAFERCS